MIRDDDGECSFCDRFDEFNVTAFLGRDTKSCGFEFTLYVAVRNGFHDESSFV